MLQTTFCVFAARNKLLFFPLCEWWVFNCVSQIKCLFILVTNWFHQVHYYSGLFFFLPLRPCRRHVCDKYQSNFYSPVYLNCLLCLKGPCKWLYYNLKGVWGQSCSWPASLKYRTGRFTSRQGSQIEYWSNPFCSVLINSSSFSCGPLRKIICPQLL